MRRETQHDDVASCIWGTHLSGGGQVPLLSPLKARLGSRSALAARFVTCYRNCTPGETLIIAQEWRRPRNQGRCRYHDQQEVKSMLNGSTTRPVFIEWQGAGRHVQKDVWTLERSDGCRK